MSIIVPNTREAGEPLLELVLRPHRSLSRRGFLMVMGLFGGLMFVIGLVFFAIGAWPVVGFLGLDVALVYLAFRINYRDACSAQEIRVTREALTIRDRTAAGVETETTFNPYWSRLEIARRPGQGIVAMVLASGRLRHEVGRFLPLPEREPVATALQSALSEVRSVPG